MRATKYFALIVLSIISVQLAFCQNVNIDVNLNVKHTVGDISVFEREKFVTLHADVTEQEWDGNNFTANLRDDFLNGYDVYMGRNTGLIQWNLNNNIVEDANRKGYADSTSIYSFGNTNKNTYKNKTKYHAYESRNNQILCAQLHPFWADGQETNKGWAFSQVDTDEEPFGTASGEFFGRFIRDFYGEGGTTGQNKPKLVEVINEPLWHLTDYGDTEPEKVFRFHNAVAKQIKKYNPNDDIQVGGFCTAFPDLEKNNFEQWKQRWKLFMDIAGENMDYWTIHLYDFPVFNGKQQYRKGSNMEATFDMMEQYSYLSFGEVKPFMISEFGAQMHDYKGAWSPYRDWLHLKSVNSMMMQFMERANIVNSAINFLPVKAEWGTSAANKTYDHRLMRMEGEPAALSGQWVYSDMVKTYQLWSDVKGTRVDSYSDDLDVLTDVFVDGNTAYVIINNLGFTEREINLKVAGSSQNLQSIQVKHLFLQNKEPKLSDYTLNAEPSTYTLGAEGTLILAYTYETNVQIDETIHEVKYYADTYYKAIKSNKAEVFAIKNVNKDEFGEVVLRIGLGRAHGKVLQPKVLFNDVLLQVPENFRGDDQKQRKSFFGVIEIPVPYSLLAATNSVSIEFPDNSGFISSVAMQVYNSSINITRSGDVKVTGLNIIPDSTNLMRTKSVKIEAELLPADASNKLIVWSSSNPAVATIDDEGNVTGKTVGEVKIQAVSVDNGFADSCIVTVIPFVPTPVDSIKMEEKTAEVGVGGNIQLKATIYPVEADNQIVDWLSSDATVATVTTTGIVKAKAEGVVTILAQSREGGYTDSCLVTVTKTVEGFLAVDDMSKYLNTEYVSGESIEVITNFSASTGETVTDELGGISVWLREMTSAWAVVKDYQFNDASVVGQEEGTSTVSVSLKGVTPSAELPNGNFYFLFPRFKSSNGEIYKIDGLSPITILKGSGGAQAYFRADDMAKYLDAEHSAGGKIEVVTEFNAGEGETVSDALGGVNVLLREMTSDWTIVNDYEFNDASAIGKNEGTSIVNVSLEGITPSNQLPEGNFYFLFPRFQSSNGEIFKIDGISPVKIVEDSGVSLLNSHAHSLSVYPNPANSILYIKNLNDESLSVDIYNMLGVKMISLNNLINTNGSIQIDVLPKGFYLIKINGSNTRKVLTFQKL